MSFGGQILTVVDVLSECEDRRLAVPKGQSRIAQRFNAGLDAKRSGVPQGRLRSNPTPHPSAVPSGLVCHAGCFPALKRRAILKMSLRDKGTRRSAFPLWKETNPSGMPLRAFTSTVCSRDIVPHGQLARGERSR